MRARTLVCVAALCCAPTASAAPRDGLQTVPAPSTAAAPAPPIDEVTRKQINDLKLKVVDAKLANDLQKELEFQKKILNLDPSDAQALVRLTEITQALQAKDAASRQDQVRQADEQAKQTLTDSNLSKAEDALIEAKRSGASEPLDRAQKFLEEARKYARPGEPRIDRLQRLVGEESAARRVRFWEWWGFIGLAAAAALAGLLVYLLRRRRVLEMIDGAQAGQIFPLQKESTALGALASEVDWAIEDPLRKISRRHCDVVRQGRHYFLVDCSMNGTFLNGRPLQKGQPALLRRGDRIGLGGAATLVFR